MSDSSPAGDPRFFACSGPFTVAELMAAAGVDAPVAAAARSFSRVAPLQSAGPDEVSFLDNRKYAAALATSRAGAVIVHPDMQAHVPPGCVALVTREPYLAWTKIATLFHPLPPAKPGCHPSAIVDPSAVVDPSAEIGPFVVIGARVEIGAQCSIAAGCIIGDGVVVGVGTRIAAACTISHALIGQRVNILPGVRIGQNGFGFATTMTPTGPRHISLPQLGRVLIEDDVDIGANTCIDRGSAQDTVIGAGSRLDNLVQIGHNVRIGRGCVIVSQVGISGSTILEDFVVLAGQVGVAGHVRIGRGARLGGQSGVMADIPAGGEYMGSPAQPIRSHFRQLAMVKRLVEERSASLAAKRNNPAPGAAAPGPTGETGAD